ncbi:killer cell lectin-like receptor subfamily I member 1 [Lepus europaeus]|uniref:killer cell lectin-like receptor subfamily I member 1 n=1 Tax=Lepus europaeus TaxID=9983 RepID=UPI002B49FF39|nr:killer cell lectin-like receptor subfamily I member 1 [Lepus europaeus]
MPKTKQNESKVNKQTIIYRDLKFSKSQQTQRISKRDESIVISNAEQVNYVELKFHKTSDPHHRKCLVRNQRKEPGSAVWPVMTGILGVLCLVLITAVGVLFANLFSSKEEQNREISLIPTTPSTKDDCSCDLSSNHWIGFGNSFYHFFNKSKTWPESQAACVELNSHLLKIDNKEEQEILSVLEMEGWIGLRMNETNGYWFWEDGIEMPQRQLTLQKGKNHPCAYMRGNYIINDDCSSRKSYIFTVLETRSSEFVITVLKSE